MTTVKLKPHTHFYRQAINAATSLKRAKEIGLHLSRDYELLEAWVREQQLVPPAPRFIVSNQVAAQGVTRRKRGSADGAS